MWSNIYIWFTAAVSLLIAMLAFAYGIALRNESETKYGYFIVKGLFWFVMAIAGFTLVVLDQ